MKKILLTTWIVALCSIAAEAQIGNRYWVGFRDKAGTPYSVERPGEFLGERALARRARLHVGIDSLDLPVNPACLEAVRQAGGRVWGVSKWLNGAIVFSDTAMDEALAALPCVGEVTALGWGSTFPPDESDYPGIEVDTIAYSVPYDTGYYGYGRRNIIQLNLMPLHRAGYDGEGVLVGVCDAGYPGVESREIFAPLRESGRLVATRDFAYAGDNVFTVMQHGTSVLGCMAGLRPGLYVGSAPQASYILCRTEKTNEESPIEEYHWVCAMEYLDSMGVDIVNNSIGYSTFDDSIYNHAPADFDGATLPMSRVAAMATSRGILVVVAAGNDGYLGSPNIYTPADAASALTVGAVTRDGERASFSSWGPTADGRIKPDVMALGEMANVVVHDGLLLSLNGTSFAAPIMTGAAACLMQMHPDWHPGRVCDSLRAWGDNSATPDNEYGYGIPDMGRALADTAGLTAGIGRSPGSESPYTLHPNPADRLATVVLPTATAQVQAALYDTLGRIQRHDILTARQSTIDLGGLAAGVYILRLTAPEGQQTLRLIKR